MINIKISVLIPMFNSKKTIVSAIDSVLYQTYTEGIEIIVVNDGSKDGCEKIVEDIILNNQTNQIIRLINQSNCGVSSARNKGLREANGEYIAFLDSDDTWHPKKLEIVISLMEENKISFLGHSYILEDDFIQIYENKRLKKISFLQMLIKNISQTSCIVIKKNTCEFFNENMTHTEDHELWLRISLAHNLYYFNFPLTKLGRQQLSVGGLSSNRWAMRKGEIQMYKNITMRKKTLLPFLPFLIVFSLIKHFRNYTKDIYARY